MSGRGGGMPWSLRLAERASLAGVWFGGTLVILSAFLIGYDVVVRKLFNFTVGGADELSGPQAAGVAEDRRIAGGAVKTHLAEYHDDDRGEQQQHQREGAQLDGGTGDSHGLIVFSPTWRPQMYSRASG